jgi:Tol biopolymer transport system component
MLWVRPLAEVAAKLLPGTENAKRPFWSADSQWLGFHADGKIKKVAAAGGAVQTITETRSDFRGGAWGPDNTLLFGIGAEPVYRVDAAGGEVKPATTPASSLERHVYPTFLPDGRHFLYLLQNSTPEQTGIYEGSLDEKIKKMLLRVNVSAAYAPLLQGQEGYLLFIDGDKLMGLAFNPTRFETSGHPFLIAEHAGRNSAFYSAVAASAGTLAYAGLISQTGRLTWFDRGGNPLGAIGPEGDYPDVRLSPDEESLAASLVEPKTGNMDIWIHDLRRNNISRFSSGRSFTATPLWAADGGRLIYRSFETGLVNLYRKSAGGGGVEETVLTHEVEKTAGIGSTSLVPTDWSPNGASVLFSVPSPASGNDLWILPLTGDKKPVKYIATPAEELHGNFSPDGQLVAYSSNESGKFEIYVETFPRSDHKWTVSTNGGYEPRWRADGREIYYLSEARELMAVGVGKGPQFDVPAGLFQTRVAPGITAFRTHYVPSRDGKRFLVNTLSADQPPTPIIVMLNWQAALKK